jgi:hypothetical protein
MSRPSRIVLAGTVLAASLLPGRAHAFERQWHLGGGVGAGFFSDSETSAGPLLGVHAAYGLSDMFDAKLEGLAAVHSLGDESFQLFSGSAGLAYKVDVIQWIPYFAVQVGYYHLTGDVLPGNLSNNELGLSVDLGLDYAVSRSFGMGVQLRYHGFLNDPMSSMADAPYFCGLVRAEYRWGY